MKKVTVPERSKTSVLHVVPRGFGGASGVFGGAERYVHELARFMSRRTSTRILTFGDNSEYWEDGPLQVHVLGQPWLVRGQYHNPFSLKVIREAKQASIIHCHQQHVLVSSFLALLGKVLRKKVFVTELGGGGWDISAYLSTDSWYSGHLHISAYSRKIYNHAENHAAHVIYGGVDREKFFPAKRYRTEGPILYVGRLLPHKGVDYLIEGVPANLPVKIIGKPLDKSFLDHLKKLAKGKQIEFLHQVEDGQLLEIYQGACCVVLPSVYQTRFDKTTKVPELLGQTLLEGMACAIPAICTDVASMPEVVQDKETGFVVPPNDPKSLYNRLQWFKDNPDASERMGKAGLRRVSECFDWDRVVDDCFRIYGIHPVRNVSDLR